MRCTCCLFMLTLWSAAAECNNRMPMCIGSFSLHSKWIGLSKRYPNSSVLRRDVESDRLIGNLWQRTECKIKIHDSPSSYLRSWKSHFFCLSDTEVHNESHHDPRTLPTRCALNFIFICKHLSETFFCQISTVFVQSVAYFNCMCILFYLNLNYV